MNVRNARCALIPQTVVMVSTQLEHASTILSPKWKMKMVLESYKTRTAIHRNNRLQLLFDSVRYLSDSVAELLVYALKLTQIFLMYVATGDRIGHF